jgi:hypothetical protein
MIDDKFKVQRVNVLEDYLVDWAYQLNTTRERVREAISAVGPRLMHIKRWLKEKDRGRD